MAIGKKRSGASRSIGAESDAAKNARRQQAIALAQKSATENAAANRQLDTARAQAAPATLMHAPAPSRLGERFAHDRSMQDARFGEAARQRDWQGTQSALDRAWRSSEAALGREESARQRDWQSGEADRTRQFNAEQSQRERDLRERMSNASLQNQFLINAANQASADRRAREALRSRERIKEMGLRGDAANYDYNLALQRLKNEGGIGKENVKGAFNAGRDAAKYAHEREKWDFDAQQKRADFEYEETFKAQQKRADEEYKEQQKIREEEREAGRRRFSEDEKLVNAGTHEWGYTPEQQQTIDDLWHTYDEAIENGEADEDDLRELEAQIQSKIDAMPKRAIRRTDVEALANDRFLWKDDGRVFDVQTGRLVDKPDKEQKTAEQIAGGIYTLSDGTKVYSDGNTLKQVPSSIPKDPTYADYQKYLRDFEKNKDVVSNPDAQPMSAQDFVKQWRDFNGALRPNDVQGNNPNGFSNEYWAWITEQFNAGNLTDMELRSLGLTVVNGELVPIDYGAEAGSAAPARTNVPAPSASAPSAATAGTGTVNLNAPATTADERRNKWAARARR